MKNLQSYSLSLLIGVLVAFSTAVYAAENPELTKQLRKKYAMVQYHPECGGWYFIRYQEGDQTYYGFVDKEGNVVAQNATEYKIYKGYIQLYVLDPLKKAKHDDWLRQMEKYQQDMHKYEQVENDYSARKRQYDAQVANAKEVATQIYEQRRQEAADQAIALEKQRQAYQQSQQQQGSGWAGILGAVLQGVGNGISLAAVGKNAADAVQFEPIFNEVKVRNGLSSAPIKPYNPKPTKPTEPVSGFEWQTHPFLQPNPYSYIDYAAIQETGTYADVIKDGRYGLVNAAMEEIYPCNNNEKIKNGVFLGMTLIKVNGKIGLLNEYKEVFKPKYTWINSLGDNVMALQDYMWGLYNKQGKPLTQHIFSNYEPIGTNGFLGQVERQWGVYSNDGSQILPPQYDKISLKENFLYCNRNGKWGLFTTKGKVILPTVFDNIKEEKGYMFCEKKRKWGIYNADAKEIYPCQFDKVKLEIENGKKVLYTQQKGMWGVLDFESGNEILPNNYSDISVIRMNKIDFYKVKKDNKLGLYDMNGVMLIPCQYEAITQNTIQNEIGSFPVFEARNDGKVSVFSYRGMPLLPHGKYTKYEYVPPFFYVWDGQKEGVVTEFGVELIACENDKISYSPQAHCFIVQKGTMYRLLDDQGQIMGDEMQYNPLNFYKDYILVQDPVRNKYAAYDYQGHPITKRTFKNSSQVHDMITRYQKKHPLSNQNKEVNEQVSVAKSMFDQQMLKWQDQRSTFSYFAKNYVERIINEWQKKGEFENSEEWQKRVNNETRAQKVYELTKAAQDEYIAMESLRLPPDQISISGTYDADHQVFRITSKYAGKDILVPVPRGDAEEFRNSFKEMKKVPKFFVENDKLGVAEYAFHMPSSNQVYTYNNKTSLTYTIAQVKYDFDDISISTDALNIGTSDVDVQIPENDVQNPNLYVFIFANESYQEAPRVDFAFNDGLTVKNYCIRTLGVPTENIHFRPNATLSQMKFEINKIRDIATNSVMGKDARFIIYYSGHGIPDEKGKSSYLLPVDGVPYDLANTAYNVSDLYATLGDLACENTIILDACFSGVTRSGNSLSNTKAVSIASKGTPRGRTVVLSASRDNEVAHLYEEKAHSMFTYFLLKKMQESKGDIAMGEWFKDAQQKVIRRSVLMKKQQNPTASAGNAASNWSNRRLK